MIYRNSSDSSTVASASIKKLAQSSPDAQPLTSRPVSRKRVRFNESANVYFNNKDRCFEDCHETWFASHEYQEFRSSAKSIINYLQMIESEPEESFCTLFCDIFDEVSAVDFVLEDASNLACKLKTKLAALYFELDNMELIGLEYHLSKEVKLELKKRRESIQETVYKIQTEYDQGLWSDAEVDNELRDSCCNFSQAACLLAQLVATAQLMA